MIQRIQTIWLLLAAAAAFSTLKFASFSGNMVETNSPVKTFTSLTATSNLIILILTVALGVASFIAIFLYKNRKLQMRIAIAALVASLLNIVLYYYQSRKFAEGTFDLTASITLAIPIFLVLAAKGIYKDQKLVKSLDRLR